MPYRNLIEKIWAQKNLISYLLAPLSGFYRLGMAIRKWSYQLGLRKVNSFDVPVIIVGNITVGGSGKTPLVIALVEWLKNQGWRPGIVSRGYGAIYSHTLPQTVFASSDVNKVGDEAILLAHKTACPMVVCKNRVYAVASLLTQFSCNVVISDDGLQHLRLNRNIEIAVVDGARRYGNEFCLPAGPLREPLCRLNTVDMIVNNGGNREGEYPMRLVPKNIYQLINPHNVLSVTAVQGRPVHAIAGIGNPQRFFKTLENLGFQFSAHSFPDHHLFQKENFNFEQDAIIIMTEKDAVKCQGFADSSYWCLPVRAELPEAFFLKIQKKIMNQLSPSLY
ncbi:MAG: tetraacyldisaccharide 4'-kinase [Proteobacteria bacterium]|nr:tetraacyldisaccharide 4'-kinase [Pseudomonadota bacterium]